MIERTDIYRPTAVLGGLMVLLAVIGGQASMTAAQRMAVLAPDATELSKKAVPICAEAFSKRFMILDSDMAEAAFKAARPETPFNMTSAEARALASVIGVDTLMLVKAETLRRSSLERPEYYETSVVLYIVDGRSGLLERFEHDSVDAPSPAEAQKFALERAAGAARAIAAALYDHHAIDISRPKMEEIAGDAETPGFKPPAPYKRIKPDYPRSAYLYNIRAVVEVEVDIAESGNVTRTSVVRWAGYGLDDAVVDAVKEMNWRPAMRDGKPLAMRVLLRYNFTKIEKE